MISLVISSLLNTDVDVRDARLSGVVWYLTHFETKPQPLDLRHFTLVVDNQRSQPPLFLTGRMACNSYLAQFASPITGSLNITDWSSTLVLCLPESEMERDRQFATRMKLIATYQVESSSGHQTLTFYDASKFELLRFITLNNIYLPLATR